MKTVRLTPKEITRSVEYGSKPGSWVIVTRPQPDGQYWIAVIDVATGMLVNPSFQSYTDSKQGLSIAVGKFVRDMDKFTGLSNKMTDRGRSRYNDKWVESSQLRKATIRLAHANPELRAHLLPLLSE